VAFRRLLVFNRTSPGISPSDMLIAGIVVAVLVMFLLAGAVECGYLTRVWGRTSRMGRGRKYTGD
jgi:hypothetical protein